MNPELKLMRSIADGGGGDDKLYSLLMDLGEKVDKLVEDVASFEETRQMVLNHIRGEDTIIEEFKSAFPGGDPLGHCEWHEAEIARIRARKEFWTKMTFELAKWGLIGFLGWAFIQLWHGALQGPVK